MALFGKKKGETPGESGAQTPQNADGAFDFDSVARDLGAQNGPSPFDDLMAKPASSANFADDDDPFAVAPSKPVPPLNSGLNTGSAFDFPDETMPTATQPPVNVPVDLTPANAANINSGDGLSDLDALFGESAPPSTPVASTAPVSPTPVSAQVPPVQSAPATAAAPIAPETRAKKPFPLIPALLAGGILGAAALAGIYFTQPSEEEPTPIAATSPTPRAAREPASGDVPETRAAPLPTVAPQPGSLVTNDPRAVPLSNSNLKIVPTKAPITRAPATNTGTNTSTTVTSNSRVTTTTTSPPSPEVLAQLKGLWEQGRDAKARGDFASARQFWQEALRIRPGHPGFQESIDKLPAQNTAPAPGPGAP